MTSQIMCVSVKSNEKTIMNWYGFETKDDANYVQLFEGLCMASRLVLPSVGDATQGIGPGARFAQP